MSTPFRPTAPTRHIAAALLALTLAAGYTWLAANPTEGPPADIGEWALRTASAPTEQAEATRAVAFADEAVQKKAVAPR